MSLPTDNKARKALPLYDGTWGYFPDALAEMARVSQVGNEQHNPGQPLHWAREKSTDQMNTCQRHLVDRGSGVHKDTDGTYHLAKVMWRAAAQLQLDIEAERKAAAENPEPEFPSFDTDLFPSPCADILGAKIDALVAEGEAALSAIGTAFGIRFSQAEAGKPFDPADLPMAVNCGDPMCMRCYPTSAPIK